MSVSEQQIYDDLVFLYGEELAAIYTPRLISRLNTFQSRNPGLMLSPSEDRFSEGDAILITYGDMVGKQDASALRTLAEFLQRHVGDAINALHILPFFPSSSDDGFSVIDYRQVDPALGDWTDIDYLNKFYKLAIDAVINHISAESAWYQAFLAGDPEYQEYFIQIHPDMDLSQVFRPRSLPVQTPVSKGSENIFVWTTFSEDQIDLNYKSPKLMLEIVDVLLFYIEHGARYIRLDAIAFVWKESGTSCVHLDKTHRIVQLMRKVFDWVAPYVSIISETNVPHKENISYFGDGSNEAQMVYNFPLPPLTLHAFYNGNAKVLSKWAETLFLPSQQTTFLNFLASHDGIGVTPLRGIIPIQAVTEMCQRVENLGGFVSYKMNPDGSRSPYELNINYLDALRDPGKSIEEDAYLARRFLATQAIMLALRGIPGIYFHSLFGSRNWEEGVEQTGRYRSINRQKIPVKELETELSQVTSIRHQIFQGYLKLLKVRTSRPAFHPTSEQKILFCHEAVFALQRYTLTGSNHVLCLHNVSDKLVQFRIDWSDLGDASKDHLTDTLSGIEIQINKGELYIDLEPYAILWLE